MTDSSTESKPILIPRLGNLQAVIEQRGRGVFSRPVARFSKLLPAGAPADAHQVYELEEVALLKELCERILNDAYRMQTLVVPSSSFEAAEPGQAIERPTPPAMMMPNKSATGKRGRK